MNSEGTDEVLVCRGVVRRFLEGESTLAVLSRCACRAVGRFST